MTKPTRWSEATSDADPVLRAVMRYAQDIQPSAQDLATLTARVAREESRSKSRAQSLSGRGWSRRALRWSGAFAAVGVAGVALGMTVTRGTSREEPPAAIAPNRTAAVERRRAPVVVSELEAPPPLPPSAMPAPARPRAVGSAAAAPATSSPSPVTESLSAEPGLGAASELSLLAEARRDLKSQPAKTLTLLGDHGTLFPRSSFGEERAALRIEALFGVGRRAEAERELEVFKARYPSSIYTLRLSAARQH